MQFSYPQQGSPINIPVTSDSNEFTKIENNCAEGSFWKKHFQVYYLYSSAGAGLKVFTIRPTEAV